ncbi:helix-turn-helix transcriptional regulator [Lysobacter silvisoli]|uniref:AraC family transcriptional regulator n=1 Tax=Lysobacter silvisoli TaxID=2293254 RepID=A0A371K256_9GAMM|nr:helix-turn-helix transcriptional regulator [Lysobacter silvisoli]RDZ27995.1 AraC family transcriptional regulator [Lysobacter silvisoli]
MHSDYHGYGQQEGWESVEGGQLMDSERAPSNDGFQLYLVRDFGSVRVAAGSPSYWLQLRGRSTVESREGRFALVPNQWIAFDRDSAPRIDSERHGLAIGFSCRATLMRDIERHARLDLMPGEGRMEPGQRRALLRLWRQCAGARSAGGAPNQRLAAFRMLLACVHESQRELDGLLARCPGRRRARQRQVLGRLQRARLYLRGNSHRVVLMDELAQLTSFSTWWLSKTFRNVYGTTVQAASVNQRIAQACELLRDSPLSISEVSHACGFDSPCSFARTFRLRMGCTASAYRADPERAIRERAEQVSGHESASPTPALRTPLRLVAP